MPQNELFKKTNLFPDRDKMRVKLRSESEQIGRVISGIVESARHCGENYIIDGIQLLPEFLPLDSVHLFIITCSDPQVHRERFEHPTITRARHKTANSYEMASMVESILLEESLPYSTPVVDNAAAPEVTAGLIAERIRAAVSVRRSLASDHQDEAGSWTTA